jgi:hypothetical protein
VLLLEEVSVVLVRLVVVDVSVPEVPVRLPVKVLVVLDVAEVLDWVIEKVSVGVVREMVVVPEVRE